MRKSFIFFVIALMGYPIFAEPHAYFNWLKNDSGFHIYSRGYRTQHEINGDLHDNIGDPEERWVPAEYVQYDPIEDAARWFIEQRAVDQDVSLADQIRPVFEKILTGTVMFVFDAKWDVSLQANRGNLDGHKAFQIGKYKRGGGDKRRLELRTRFQLVSPPSIAKVDLRRYNFRAEGRDAPVPNQVNDFIIEPNKWTRFWVFIDMGKGNEGTFSWWMADEDRNPVMLFDHLPMEFDIAGGPNSGNGIDWFWFEYNASRRGSDGDLFGWFRNFVVLKGVTDPGLIINQGRDVSGEVGGGADTAPIILSQPRDRSVSNGDFVSFSVNSIAKPAATFQWQKNGQNIAGANKSSYAISTAQESNAGTYRCVLSNSLGTVTSNEATLIVNGSSGDGQTNPPEEGTNPDPGRGSDSAAEPFQNLLSPSNGGTVSIPCQSQVGIFQGSQEVRVLECGSNGFAEWDGRNNEGELVSVGVYLVLENGTEVRKVVVLQ